MGWTMSKNLFGQEYECDWVTTEGQIYDLAEEKHLQDLSDIYENVVKFWKQTEVLNRWPITCWRVWLSAGRVGVYI